MPVTRLHPLALGLLVSICAAHLLSGQIVSGNIVGNVRDPTAAAVVGANVTLESVETNQRRMTVTNQVGAYTFPALPPGHYRLSVKHPGFRSAATSEIELQIDQTVRIDVALQLGEVPQTVTVDATAAALLQTDTSTVGQVISEKPIVELPLNGRNFLQHTQSPL